jgi:hypothetical protein
LPSRPLDTTTGDTDARAKGRFFGIELEGLSPEDQEFETAKAFVRFAGEATRLAASAADALPAVNVAHAAALQSARRNAPGWLQLARPATASITGPHGSTTGARYASTLRGANHA